MPDQNSIVKVPPKILPCPKKGCDVVVDMEEEAACPGADIICERCGTVMFTWRLP